MSTEEQTYKFRFTGTEKSDHTKYIVEITDVKANKTWKKKDRYSKMRLMHTNLGREIKTKSAPEFPPKKWFGNMEDKFVVKREQLLQNYYGAVGGIPELVKTKVFQEWIVANKIQTKEDEEKPKETKEV
eukprot:CAMPEP_0115003612 /NCGR_PEP_ID=MMETSP0216-20121206/18716_1 /TAXON_ID=223996 /ORGANISM="Protocruzia adherens, Strain Boccale" /LENGTH=128 /DNA_ID=CAMNT_0002369453 /DNA_START=38 /DNA_END=424 /DNA_ORIENTATION=-